MEITLPLVLGYAGAVFTGLILGLLGGGGALLSIPVLVYFFHMDATAATGYSLFLVGVTATSGALHNVRRKAVDYKAALYYGIPSVTTVYLFRRFIVHRLPDIIFSTSYFTLTRDHLILFFLCLVMFGVAYRMITATEEAEMEENHTINHPVLALYAVVIGCFIGLVGAGGGFLMTPALTHFANLNIKKAIATSLLLVAVNSFIGFLGDMHSNLRMDWHFLLVFSVFSISGVLLGSYLNHRIHGLVLKKAFGWFVLGIAFIIIAKETRLF
jgi:uncharacterized membrane protein YfcA